MAQHDYSIANQGFPAFRSDLNDALAAIVSNNSGATEPTTMFAHQMWVDTAANPSVLKIRNADNDAWITIGSIDQTGDTFTLTSAVSATTLNTSGAVVFNDAGADVDFRVEGDTDANLLFVDASADKVGVGTSTPSQKLDVVGTILFGEIRVDSQNKTSRLGAAHYTNAEEPVAAIVATSTSTENAVNIGGGTIQFNAANTIKLLTAANNTTTSGTERMRIDSSGNLLVGKTTALNNAIVGVVVEPNARINLSRTGSASETQVAFYRNASATPVGTITTTSTATAFNTSSDYRLKENVAPMTGALAKVLELKPCTYTWKVDGSAGEGFIAHELQAVCPDAVTGEKDETEIQKVEVSPAVPATYDEEGNELTPAVEAVYEEREVPKYQGVDTSFLVATLTAAIQELKAELDAAKERIAALENA